MLIPKNVTPRTARSSIACALGLKHTLQLLPRLSESLLEIQKQNPTRKKSNGDLLDSIIERLGQDAFGEIQTIIDRKISEGYLSPLHVSKFSRKLSRNPHHSIILGARIQNHQQ